MPMEGWVKEGENLGRSPPGRIPIILLTVLKRRGPVAPPLRIQPFQNGQRSAINSASLVGPGDTTGAIHQFQIILEAEKNASLKAVSDHAFKA